MERQHSYYPRDTHDKQEGNGTLEPVPEVGRKTEFQHIRLS